MKTSIRNFSLLAVLMVCGPGMADPPRVPLVYAVPNPPITNPRQAAEAARRYLLREYPHGKTGIGALSFTKPQGLVNWAAPGVTFVKDWPGPKYHGPAWVVHFVAPRPPGARPHVIQLPGNDFGVALAADGRLLTIIQASD